MTSSSNSPAWSSSSPGPGETSATTPVPDLDPSQDKNWVRLQYLLSRSQIYANILLEKMATQAQAQRAREEKEERERLRKEKEGLKADGEDKGEEAKVRRATRATKDQDTSPAMAAEPAPKKRGGRGGTRGKKAAAEANSLASLLDPTKLDNTTSTTEALALAAQNEDSTRIGLHTTLHSARQPKLVTGGVMKPYQLEGLDWLCSLYENGLNGILADEMGLGKTLQTISFLAFLREKKSYGPFLVVAPVSTLSNWVDEFRKFTPDIPVVLYHGTPQERENLRKKCMNKLGPDFPVVCTSYELVMRDKKFLQRYSWNFIIIDEGHRIKNLNCKLIRELKSYDSANRLLLTGTPLQNNLAELWALLNFLLPDIFDDLNMFQSWFDFSALQEKEGHKLILEADRKTQIVSSLHAILKPFLLRRIKADVESQLPPKREYVLYAPLTREQKELYRSLKDGKGREFLVNRLNVINGEWKNERSDSKGQKEVEAPKRKLETSHGGPKKIQSVLQFGQKAQPKEPMGEKSSHKEKSGKGNSGKRKSPGEMPDDVKKPEKRQKPNYEEIDDNEWFRQLENGELYPRNDKVDNFTKEMSFYEKQFSIAIRAVASKKLQNLMMQLRQACNSPYLFYWPFHPTPQQQPDEYGSPDERLVTSSGKMLLLDTLLPALFARGHKVLIFSQFTRQLDIIEIYAMELRGWHCARIDGSVKLDERSEQIKRFSEDPEWKLFLLSTRAGGLGINLTAADTVILFDSDWNPQMDLQAMDRAHRIGQKKPVVVYRFASQGTVEEMLLEKADAKRRLERLVMQKGKFKSLATVDDKMGDGGETLESILMREDFEKVEVVEDTGVGGKLLSDEELKMLLDRSPEAYERAAKGEEQAVLGKTGRFKVMKTKREEGDVVQDIEGIDEE